MTKCIKNFWEIIKKSGAEFGRHNGKKLSASLAFFTIFSLGPMMMVIIFVSKLFFGRQAIEGTIQSQLSGLIGDAAALQIQSTIKNATIHGSGFIAILSSAVLIIAATTVFNEIQSSINIIWNLKVKSGRTWRHMLKKRLLAFVLVIGLGVLLLLSLLLNGLLEGFKNTLQELFPDISFLLVYAGNILITGLIVASLFAIIYKVMPYAIVRWRHAIAGAIFTTLLFMVSKFCITIYINNSDISNTYSTTGSLVVLLLWIFTSSLVLYFGAALTKVYATNKGAKITPDKNAVRITQIENESN